MGILNIAFTLILAVSPAARAIDRDTDAMIARGLELRREGKPEQALTVFQRAHALAPSPRTVGHMGLVEGALEHWTDAEAHLTQSLAVAGDPWVKKQKALLKEALESVKAHIGQIVFLGTPGASVSVAGKPVGTLPDIPPIRLPAGAVLVTASGPNAKPFVERVGVQAGMQTPVTITLHQVDIPVASASGLEPRLTTSSPPTPAIPTLHSHYTWKTWTGGAMLGLGAAAVTWGIIWVVLDGKSSGRVCADGTGTCNPVYDTKGPGWILTGAGAALAAVGGLLLYNAQTNGTDVTVGMAPWGMILGGQF